MCAPFFGGGSFELACASRGVKVYGYDIFAPVVEFWACLRRDAQTLRQRVASYYPLTKARFRELRTLLETGEAGEAMERAAIFFVLNRASFSGSTLSGGWSDKTCRFTKDTADKLTRDSFAQLPFTVTEMDFRDAIPKHPNDFLFLDPPYLLDDDNSVLYGVNGSTHKNFDHQTLFDLLKDRERWLMTYNDSTIIRDMYSDFVIETPHWPYGMAKNKKSREVVILSGDLQTAKSYYWSNIFIEPPGRP